MNGLRYLFAICERSSEVFRGVGTPTFRVALNASTRLDKPFPGGDKTLLLLRGNKSVCV